MNHPRLITTARFVQQGDRITVPHHTKRHPVTADVVSVAKNYVTSPGLLSIALGGMPFAMAIDLDQDVHVVAGVRQLRGSCRRCNETMPDPWTVTTEKMVPTALADDDKVAALCVDFADYCAHGLCPECLFVERDMAAPDGDALMMTHAWNLVAGDVIVSVEGGTTWKLRVQSVDKRDDARGRPQGSGPRRGERDVDVLVYVDEYPLPLKLNGMGLVVLDQAERVLKVKCKGCTNVRIERTVPLKDLITPSAALSCGLAAVEVEAGMTQFFAEIDGCCGRRKDQERDDR